MSTTYYIRFDISTIVVSHEGDPEVIAQAFEYSREVTSLVGQDLQSPSYDQELEQFEHRYGPAIKAQFATALRELTWHQPVLPF